MSGTKLVSDLGLRCQVCARLRFGSPRRYRSAFSRAFVTAFYGGRRTSEPLPRTPWDPRAVSDPWLVAEEFGRQRTPTANGGERDQGQAARETPAMTTPTVPPLEFKDNATGEHFDIV